MKVSRRSAIQSTVLLLQNLIEVNIPALILVMMERRREVGGRWECSCRDVVDVFLAEQFCDGFVGSSRC